MATLYLLTTNPDKLIAAKSVFDRHGIAVQSLELELPEIQASTSQEIANYAAQQAHAQTGKPVIREDHSFYIKDLGLPGPYMTFADKVVSPELLVKLVDQLPSRAAYFELAAAYVDSTGKLHEFSYQVPVEIARRPAGDTDQRWERVMTLPGDRRTFAEYPASERAALWTKNYESIARLLTAT